MRTIDDKQLDELITESLQRQHTFESINSQVLAEVKRYNRVRKWKTILRLVAFAFGVPTMLAVMELLHRQNRNRPASPMKL